MDPQRSIFSRFRRTRALSPSQTLYPTVIGGHGQSETDKTRLNRPNRVRRPRANMSLCYHAEDPRDENWIKMILDVSQTTSFGSHCVRNTLCADIGTSNSSKPQEMSDWDRSDDLELLQTKSEAQKDFDRFQSKSFLDPQRSIFNRFRRTRALSPSHTLHPTVIEAQGQSEIDKTRLSRPNRVRDLARTHLWVIARRTLQTKIRA